MESRRVSFWRRFAVRLHRTDWWDPRHPKEGWSLQMYFGLFAILFFWRYREFLAPEYELTGLGFATIPLGVHEGDYFPYYKRFVWRRLVEQKGKV